MCNQANFVHLHNHTDHSLQDALPKPKALALRMREMGMVAGAITDHGRMGGIPAFVEGCRMEKDGLPPLKPILGCEIYTCKDRFDKSQIEIDDGNGGTRKRRQKHNHLTLLAMNREGYVNLDRRAHV